MNALPEPSTSPEPALRGPVLDRARIRAITIDLDDTLWPIAPTIERAEKALRDWLADHAPQAVLWCEDAARQQELRRQVRVNRPDLAHDLGAQRREAIRLALLHAGEDPALDQAAFEVFYDMRQRVDLYDDALPALQFLSDRFPVVALSNGNADVDRVGIGRFFSAAISMRSAGIGKPHAPIFHAAADLAGVAVGDVLHVGDDAHLDGVGGLEAGMQVAWVNRPGGVWTPEPHVPHITVSNLTQLCAILAQD